MDHTNTNTTTIPAAKMSPIDLRAFLSSRVTYHSNQTNNNNNNTNNNNKRKREEHNENKENKDNKRIHTEDNNNNIAFFEQVKECVSKNTSPLSSLQAQLSLTEYTLSLDQALQLAALVPNSKHLSAWEIVLTKLKPVPLYDIRHIIAFFQKSNERFSTDLIKNIKFVPSTVTMANIMNIERYNCNPLDYLDLLILLARKYEANVVDMTLFQFQRILRTVVASALSLNKDYYLVNTIQLWKLFGTQLSIKDILECFTILHSDPYRLYFIKELAYCIYRDATSDQEICDLLRGFHCQSCSCEALKALTIEPILHQSTCDDTGIANISNFFTKSKYRIAATQILQTGKYHIQNQTPPVTSPVIFIDDKNYRFPAPSRTMRLLGDDDNGDNDGDDSDTNDSDSDDNNNNNDNNDNKSNGIFMTNVRLPFDMTTNQPRVGSGSGHTFVDRMLHITSMLNQDIFLHNFLHNNNNNNNDGTASAVPRPQMIAEDPHKLMTNVKDDIQDEVAPKNYPFKCVACKENKSRVICQPCGHVCMCKGCTARHISDPNPFKKPKCPLCAIVLTSIGKFILTENDDDDNDEDEINVNKTKEENKETSK
jgi:hypothetical protein